MEASNIKLMIIVIVLKIIFAIFVYFSFDFESSKKRNLFTFLSFPFPIITTIICITKYKKSAKSSALVVIMLIASIVGTSVSSGLLNDTKHINKYDMVFCDSSSNEYKFNFDKSGYDKLYINDTDEYLISDLCFLDADGYLCYDDDCSITARDESSCVDEDGSVYYPARYSTFNEDGSIQYALSTGNFSYDRFGKAYTYEYVPYYDREGNKYHYSFDSATQQGAYTSITTKESFDNENCYVDTEGYFVYDYDRSFIRQNEIKNVMQFTDNDGNVYYWASSVFWDENGQLLDSFKNVIAQ